MFKVLPCRPLHKLAFTRTFQRDALHYSSSMGTKTVNFQNQKNACLDGKIQDLHWTLLSGKAIFSDFQDPLLKKYICCQELSSTLKVIFILLPS